MIMVNQLFGQYQSLSTFSNKYPLFSFSTSQTNIYKNVQHYSILPIKYNLKIR